MEHALADTVVITLVVAQLLETRYPDKCRIRDCISLFTTCAAARSVFTLDVQTDFRALLCISPNRQLVFTSSGYCVGHFRKMKALFDHIDSILSTASHLESSGALHCAGQHCGHARNIVARRHRHRLDAPIVHTLCDDSSGATRLVRHAREAPVTLVLAPQRSGVRRGSTTPVLSRYTTHGRILKRTHRVDVSRFEPVVLFVSADGAHTMAFDRQRNLFVCTWDDTRPGSDKTTNFKTVDSTLTALAISYYENRQFRMSDAQVMEYVRHTGQSSLYQTLQSCFTALHSHPKGPPGCPWQTTMSHFTWSGWDCADGYDVSCGLWITHLRQGTIVIC